MVVTADQARLAFDLLLAHRKLGGPPFSLDDVGWLAECIARRSAVERQAQTSTLH